jgi:hypothetical protein
VNREIDAIISLSTNIDIEIRIPEMTEAQLKVFADHTELYQWIPENSDNAYYIHYVSDRHCNNAPWSNDDEWICVSLPHREVWGEDEEIYDKELGRIVRREPQVNIKLYVVAGVWSAKDNHAIAVWAADEGDGHIEFYGLKEYAELFEEEKFDDLTELLSTQICEEYQDSLDDGSGIKREIKLVTSFNLPELDMIMTSTVNKKKKSSEDDDE